MTQLIGASNGGFIQAVACPVHAKTTNITTVVGNAASAAALAEGLYRIYSPIDVNICAGDAADTNDMLLPAGSVEYFYFDGSTKLAVFAAAAGSIVRATLV